jgi:hypothetical protein
MAEVDSLSTIDASNTARFPENMAPSAVNNGARALEGMIARWLNDINGSLASAGSANAYTLAINRTDFAASSTYDGYILTFQASFANTGAATLNVTPSGGAAVGTKTIKKNNDQDLASGDIESGQVVVVCYDNSTDTFQLLSPVANAPLTDPMTTRGDLLGRNSSNVTARLAVGAANYALVSDGTDFAWGAVLRASVAATLTKGYAATPYDAGTKSSGTYTPDESNGNFQYAVNGGAHTLAPPTNNCTIIVQYTNNGSAGAVTTSGFTKVSGSFTTTNGDDFFCFITKNNGFSFLRIEALQ